MPVRQTSCLCLSLALVITATALRCILPEHTCLNIYAAHCTRLINTSYPR